MVIVSSALPLSPGQTDSQVSASWTCKETCVGWPNSKKLVLTCMQIWSRPKWSQVNTSARKAWPNGVASRSKFSTCDYLRVRLTRALDQYTVDQDSAKTGNSLSDIWGFDLTFEVLTGKVLPNMLTGLICSLVKYRLEKYKREGGLLM